MKGINSKIIIFAILALLLTMGTAHAILFKAGPVDPNNGFPSFYRDIKGLTGTRLTLCLDPQFCRFDPPDPLNNWSTQVGFGREAPYWEAKATIRNGIVTADLQVRVLASYQAEIADGNQMTENHLSIKASGLPNGVYTVVHPFGQRQFTVTNGTIDFNRKVGGGPPFTAALAGHSGPFLKAVDPPPPAGFIGNPGTRQTVTGSPTGKNVFKIVGPVGTNLGGPPLKPHIVKQTLFRLQGMLVQ